MFALKTDGAMSGFRTLQPAIVRRDKQDKTPHLSGRFPELAGKFQALTLIMRADAFAIDPFRPHRHAFVPQMCDQLPMLQQKRHVVGPDFQHAA